MEEEKKKKTSAKKPAVSKKTAAVKKAEPKKAATKNETKATEVKKVKTTAAKKAPTKVVKKTTEVEVTKEEITVENNETVSVNSVSVTETSVTLKTNRKKIGIIIGAIAALLVVIVLGIIIISCSGGKKVLEYPIVYATDDDVVYVGKKVGASKEIEDDNGSGVRVYYKHKSTKKFLYLNDGDLSEITTSTGKKTKIASDVKKAFYTDDDKYIIYLDSDGDVYKYSNKETKIAKNVSSIEIAVDGKVYLIKNDDLYTVNLGLFGKKDPVKVANNVSGFVVNEDEDAAIYYQENKDDNDIYRINLKNGKTHIVAKDAKDIVAVSDDFKKIIYTTQNDKSSISIKNILKDDKKKEDEAYLDRYEGSGYDDMTYSERSEKYYVDQRNRIRDYVNEETYDVKSYNVYFAQNGKKKLLVKNASEVLAANADDKIVVYTKADIDDSKKLKISDYKYYSDFTYDIKKLFVNTVLYSKNGGKGITVEKNVTDVKAYISEDKNVYYVVTEDNDYKLYFANISLGKAKTSLISEDLYNNTLTKYKKGFLYGENLKKGEYDLMYVANTKTKKVSDSVYSYKSIRLSNDEKTVYFYKDYEDGKGDLYSYSGNLKPKKIIEDANTVYYVTDKYMFVTHDCNSQKECDLGLYKGSKKLKKIATDVTKVIAY